MKVISNFKEARTMRVKTPEDIQEEMENPAGANFALFDYHFPNGIVCGVGKSKRPSHASLFQIIVTDFNGKPNVKFPSEYAGEYTSSTRAEKSLNLYCKEAWDHAEALKTKQVRETEAAKEAEAAEKLLAEMDADIELEEMEKIADEEAEASRVERGVTKEEDEAALAEEAA